MESMDVAKKLLIKHEGLSLLPYEDTAGNLTIGYGHNLDARGITGEIAMKLLEWDLDACEEDLKGLGYWTDLSSARQCVLINMRFNLGAGGFRLFKRMHQSLNARDYEGAADEIIDSAAYRTNEGLRRRYEELAQIMRSNSFQ